MFKFCVPCSTTELQKLYGEQGPLQSSYTTYVLHTSSISNFNSNQSTISFVHQYVTLFASAFPLAAVVSIMFLFIEGRADLFKLLYVCQRPRVRRYVQGQFLAGQHEHVHSTPELLNSQNSNCLSLVCWLKLMKTKTIYCYPAK